MTKQQAIQEFRSLYPAGSFVTPNRGGGRSLDRPMRDEAWNNFTDALCKDGRITARQYDRWVHPFNGR